MKNNLIYFLLLIFVIGCGKDDEDPIVGSYRMTSLSQSDCSDPLENFEITFEEDGCGNFFIVEFCSTGTFTFEADGRFTSDIAIEASGISSQDLGASGTYTVTGTSVEICVPECETLNFDGTTITQVTSDGDCNQSITFTKI